MAEIRRGTAMLLLTAGDPEIYGAPADGIMAVRLPKAKPLTHEEARVVSAEIDRQKNENWQNVAHRLRVTMHREPVDYAGLCFDANVQYGEDLYEPGAMGKLGKKLLVAYALVVLAFDRLFESVRTK